MRQKIIRILPLILMGAGLIILGLVAAKIITANGINTDVSVVPSKVNFAAPDLTLNDLEGNRISLSDFSQQVILINNWATWCPPCRLEMPTLAKYYKAHNDQGFTMLGINAGEPKEDVAKYVKDNELTFPILLDPNDRVLTAFHNDSLPSSYVIDRDGNVVLAWTGPINRTMLEKYVTPLLEQ